MQRRQDAETKPNPSVEKSQLSRCFYMLIVARGG